MQLDEKGRCRGTNDRTGKPCGKKPMVYKRGPFRACVRCGKLYDLYKNKQIPSLEWQKNEAGEWFRPKPKYEPSVNRLEVTMFDPFKYLRS